VCLMGASRDCVPYLCGAGACGTSCTSSSQCKAGNYCSGNACVPFGAGPKLYWKFDESSGTVAADSSGSGFNGTYTGVSGTPTTSSMVPPVRFADPASRAFSAASRHAVRLAAAPAALKPTNNLTISLWFRTTSLDIGHDQGGTPGPRSSEALSLGDNYLIRIRATDIAFTRRSASGYIATFTVNQPPHLDGNWHHVAGVVSPAGTKVYFDGIERASSTRGDNLIYDQGPDLHVGRHGEDDPDWDFDGNVDDVRIYTRALAPDEVAAIAGGFF
jgi:Concanavalin A-like lectin/glucanases superfamily